MKKFGETNGDENNHYEQGNPYPGRQISHVFFHLYILDFGSSDMCISLETQRSGNY